MLSHASDSILILVDIQERLASAMKEEARLAVFRNAGVLAEAAARLDVPVMLTEQYPKGLGATSEAVVSRLNSNAIRFEKTCFSSYGVQGLREQLTGLGRRQVVLAGMEAHVCVLQTALELMDGGWRVFVAEDATCSRNPAHHGNAMERMRQAGVVVTNTESVVFEWLRDASHPEFKSISAMVR